MTVAIDASAGHSRSQKIVQRARRSARAHRPRAPAEGAGVGPRRRRADRSSPSPAKRIYPIYDINMQLAGCQRTKGRHSLIGHWVFSVQTGTGVGNPALLEADRRSAGTYAR